MLVGSFLGAAAVLVAAGCGSSKSSSAPTPVQAVETAYNSTVGGKTAHFVFTETVQESSASGASQHATVNGSGTVDFSSKAMSMTVNSPAGGQVQALLLGTDMFLQVPAAQRAQIPGGKPWAEINLAQVAQAKLGPAYAQLASDGSNNPAQVLTQLQAVSGQVTKVGSPTVAGVATTEYAASVEFSKLEAQARAKAGPTAAQVLATEAQSLHTSSLPVKVWLDSSNRIRQYQTTVPIPAASSTGPAGSGSATMTITFDAYGVAVNLAAPPSSQLANITEQVINASNG
jgi:hypothetical protein